MILKGQLRAGAGGNPSWLPVGGQPLLPYGDLKTEGPAIYGSLFWSGPLFFLRS